MATSLPPDTIRVLHSQDAALWEDYWRRLPPEMREIYLAPSYYSLYETNSVQAECFIFENERDFVLYPYLKTNISATVGFSAPQNLYDIEGAYGYNGAASTTNDGEFLRAFASAFDGYCREANIIAEFTRFNPVVGNHVLSSYLDPKMVNRNVVVDLTQSSEQLWMKSYRHSVRKNVNKARRHSLTTAILGGHHATAEHLRDFITIYHETLDKNQAERRYYFDLPYFEALRQRVAEHCLFVFVLEQGRPLAAEIVLLSAHTGYSFLGGTLERGYSVSANNLLKHEVISHLQTSGYRAFCLGGGAKMDDGAFRYKTTFAENGVVDFYIGRKIHQGPAYQELCALWSSAYPEKVEAFGSYLLKYKF